MKNSMTRHQAVQEKARLLEEQEFCRRDFTITARHFRETASIKAFVALTEIMVKMRDIRSRLSEVSCSSYAEEEVNQKEEKIQ